MVRRVDCDEGSRGNRARSGREFCLSLLVHDAESHAIRDWGAAAGLWAARRNRHAWIKWGGEFLAGQASVR